MASLAASRYVYLGTVGTDPALKLAPCDPVRRPDGRCVVGRGNALVRFADGAPRVVVRRRLRLREKRLAPRLHRLAVILCSALSQLTEPHVCSLCSALSQLGEGR